MQKEERNTAKWWKIINEENGRFSGRGSLHSITSSFANIGDACSAVNSHFVSLFKQEFPVDNTSYLFSDSTPLPVDDFELLNLFSKIKLRSAPGPDGLPTFLFKHHGILLTLPVKHLFNLCLQRGYFPENLKRAVVVPLPKVKSPKSFSDLRPISLTSIISKLLERVILSRTKDLFSSIITPDQFAYKPFSSTTCALVHMTHSWLRLLDSSSNSSLRVIAIDFSKAFDSVEHSMLLAKLHSYGFPYWSISIFRSFLTGRKQCVRIASTTSDYAAVSRGIPQGSVSGPLLFTLFINDLSPQNKDSVIHKFADDQTLTCRSDPPELACDELNHVMMWCRENSMLLNLNKTWEMHVCVRPAATQALPPLTCEGITIQRVDCVKILGLNISSNLRWANHISYIEKKSVVQICS